MEPYDVDLWLLNRGYGCQRCQGWCTTGRSLAPCACCPVLPRSPQLYGNLVALTGIEPDGCQFSLVQLGLTGCVFSPVGIPGCSETPPRTAVVTAQSQRSRGPRGAGGWPVGYFLTDHRLYAQREFGKVVDEYAVIQMG